MKLVVVTGCYGLIGSYVTRKCLDKGWKVYGVDNRTYAHNPKSVEEFNSNSNFTDCNTDLVTLKFLPDCDYVLNIAAESHVDNSIGNNDNFIHTNIVGVQNLLNLIKNKNKTTSNRPLLLHFSTDEVYGDIVEGSHTEKDLLKPSNPYSASKASADMLITAWARTYGLEYIIVRPTNNYGSGQYPEKLIPISVKMLQRGQKIRLHNKGTPSRIWLHSEDTANAVILLLEKGNRNEIYNISGDLEQTNIITVKKIIKNFYFNTKETEIDYNIYLDLEHSRPGQDVRYSLDDTKIRNLGWKPVKDFDEEIQRLVQEYKHDFRW